MNFLPHPRTFLQFLVSAITLIWVTGCTTFQVPMARDDFGLHFVEVYVNGHRGVFLVDSGASHTVLDHRFADRCLRQMESSNLRLAWLGAADTDTKEGIAEEIQIGPYRDVGPFRIHVLNLDAINNAPSRLRGVRMDGILGADFLITHGALIDYASSALRFHPSPTLWMEPPRMADPYNARR